MRRVDINDLKWDDLVMVEASVSRFVSNADSKYEPCKAEFELLAVNLLQKSHEKRIVDRGIASVSI